MARKVAVFTGTRADYGLLYWLLRDIRDDNELQLQLIVSGMHLSPEFGSTHLQIEEDGFNIDEKVEMLLSSDSSTAIAKSIGLGVIGLSDALARLNPDVLVLLGDRFEALAVAQAALILKIPILHIHGGEVTIGAYDDAIRHAITKLSHLHCAATEEYRRRIIQLGEFPDRVRNVGALGLDHIHRGEEPNLIELEKALQWDLGSPYFLATYHPATLGEESPEDAIRELLAGFDDFPEHKVLITFPNADSGNRPIIDDIRTYAAENSDRVLARKSLGQTLYHGALKHAAAVVGNSSSGIIEAPAFRVPTVNVGGRQKGRLCAKSIVHCEPDRASISKAISQALSLRDDTDDKIYTNPYGDGDASSKIIEMLKEFGGDTVKTFYDLD